MGGGGGKINKPKAARVSIRKRTREQKRLNKKPHFHSNETLAATTLSKLRQCRTNPKANVRLSGKKKRRLARDAKRLLADKAQMEVAQGSDGPASCGNQLASHTSTMDS